MIRAFVLICFLFAGATAQQPKPMPELSLPQLDGQTLRSQELKDNIVVLDFWATWCENCVSEIPAFNKLEKEYGSRGVTVIGLAVQSGWASDIQKFEQSDESRWRIGSYIKGHPELHEVIRRWGWVTVVLTPEEKLIARALINAERDGKPVPSASEVAKAVAVSEEQ